MHRIAFKSTFRAVLFEMSPVLEGDDPITPHLKAKFVINTSHNRLPEGGGWSNTQLLYDPSHGNTLLGIRR